MDKPDFSGPSSETLRNLQRQMRQMVHGYRRGKMGHKGTPVVKTPRKWCLICTAVFDPAVVTKPKAMESGFCEKCLEKLNDGYIGLVDDEGRAAFVKSTPELLEAIGEFTPKEGPKVLLFSPQQFDDIIKAHGYEMPALPLSPQDDEHSPDKPAEPPPPQPPATSN